MCFPFQNTHLQILSNKGAFRYISHGVMEVLTEGLLSDDHIPTNQTPLLIYGFPMLTLLTLVNYRSSEWNILWPKTHVYWDELV